MFTNSNCLNVIMFFTLQEEFTMSKRQKRKAPAVEEQTAIEVVPGIADFTTLGESHIVWPSLVLLQTH